MRRKKSNMSKRAIVLLLSLVLVVSTVIGTTMAYLVSSPDPVVNTFTPARVDSEVNENIENGIKTNVKIQNKSNVTAYIRAAVVVTLTGPDGVQQAVKDTHYTITGLPGTDWITDSDDFYYYTKPVAPNDNNADTHDDETDILIGSCKPVQAKIPDGYELCVEILSEAIQAEPAEAVQSAWTAVKVGTDGKLTLATTR